MTTIVTKTTSSDKKAEELRIDLLSNWMMDNHDSVITTQIANGAYGAVYDHPTNPNLVVKIANDSRRYIQYVEWCAANQDNPLVPQIESIEIIKNSTPAVSWADHFCIVVMERLKPMGDDDCDGCFCLYGIPKEVSRYLESFFQSEEISPAIMAIKHWLDALRTAIHGIHHCFDLHSGNIMWRGDQVVITDPIAG